MRIGQIVYRYRPVVGGMETYVGLLLGALQATGHSVRVYQVDTGVCAPELRTIPRPFFLPKQIGYNVGLLTRLPVLCREDWLIVHNPEHFLPVAWHRGAIVVSHGATWTADDSPRRRWLRRRATEIAFRHAPICVYNDTFVPREMGLNVVPRSRLFEQIAPGKWIIPNCVDGGRFCPGPGPDSLRRLNTILVPRNLTKSRGVDIAIRAFAILLTHHRDLNLVIAGDIIYDNLGSFVYKQELNCLVTELGLVGRVLFLGSVPAEAMPSVYNSALVTLIPTRRSEGTSLAALESMACGTPVVSTDVEGLLDLPTYHATPEPEPLATALAAVLTRRDQVAREQRETVLEVYNLQAWRQAWLSVLGQAAS